MSKRPIQIRDVTLGKTGVITAYKGALYKTERFLFHMPNSSQHFIAALSAVEGFVNWKEEENTAACMSNQPYAPFEAYITCLPSYVFTLPSYLIRQAAIYHSDPTYFDLEVRMDEQRAANLANCADRSVAEGYSLMIGGNLKTTFPEKLTAPDLLNAEPRALVYMDDRIRPQLEELIQYLKTNFLGFSVEVIEDVSSLEDSFKDVSNSCAVIGFQSAETYLACCQKRLTIEITDNKLHRNFMAKWGNPYYSLFQVDSFEELRATALFRTFKNIAMNCRLDSRLKQNAG